MTAVIANVVAFYAGGPNLVSVLGFVIAASMYLPQARAALAGAVAGVSCTSWTLSLIMASLWAVYGLMIGQLELCAPSIVGVPASALIVWKTLPIRQKKALTLAV